LDFFGALSLPPQGLGDSQHNFFTKISSSLNQKTLFCFAEIFGENIFKALTSVPG
jgi:hypothetical protein